MQLLRSFFFIAVTAIWVLLGEGNVINNQSIEYSSRIDDKLQDDPWVGIQDSSSALYVEIMQWYERFSLTYQIGEMTIAYANDTAREVMWWKFDTDSSFRSIYQYNSNSFIDTIRTLSFPIHSGDTIRYYHQIDIDSLELTDVFGPYEVIIPDTISFDVDLINVSTNSVIQHLKTLTIPPCTSRSHLFNNLWDSYKSSTGLDSIIITSRVNNNVGTQNACVRVLPVYRGPYQNRYFVRSDSYKDKKSIWFYNYWKSLILAVADSVLHYQGHNKSAITNRDLQLNRKHFFGSSLMISQGSTSGTYRIKFTIPYQGSVVFKLVNSSNGKTVLIRDLGLQHANVHQTTFQIPSNVSAGYYFVLMFFEDKFVEVKPIHYFK